MIFTKHRLVGIENKIWSGEQEKQTADYQNSMKKLSHAQNKEECIGIYLHPVQNKSASDFFHNFTYTQLYDELCCTDFSACPDSFEGMMLEQFKLYIKECLYLSNEVYPEMSENAKLFSIYSDKIHSIEEIYKAEAGKMVEWVREQLEAKRLIPIGDTTLLFYLFSQPIFILLALYAILLPLSIVIFILVLFPGFIVAAKICSGCIPTIF